MTIIDIRTCPRCKNNSLFIDADSKTGDYDSFCQECGYGNHINYKHDSRGNVITKSNMYLFEELYFCIRDAETYEIIWKKDMNDCSDINIEKIIDFINNNNIFDEAIPEGIHDICDTNFESITFLATQISCKNNTILTTNIVVEHSETAGYGLIQIDVKDENLLYYQVTQNDTKECVEKKLEEMLDSVKNKEIVSITATWFNQTTETLENIEK